MSTMSMYDYYMNLANEWIEEAKACASRGMHIMADNCRNIASQFQGKADAYKEVVVEESSDYVTMDTCDGCDKPNVQGTMLHAPDGMGLPTPVLFLCEECLPSKSETGETCS